MSMTKRFAEDVNELASRRVTCRYLRRNDEQCTAEAIAPDADVLLCTEHLARAIAIINAQTAAIRQSAKSVR